MVGIHLKDIRKDNNKTQKEFADILGIKQQYVSSYERELVQMPYELIHKVCKYFNVTADYLLGLTDC